MMPATPILWIASFLSLGLSLACCYVFIRSTGVARVEAIADKRRHNERPVPLLGGVGILVGVLAGTLLLWAFGPEFEAKGQLLPALGALGFTLLFGLADDALEIRARWKFIGQNAVTLLLLWALYGVDTPCDRLLGEHTWIAFGLKWFWCLGLLNSMNLIDGLDGLSSGITMLVLGFVLMKGTGDSVFHVPLKYVVFPAVMGFFIWNRHPARIYLGEIGAQLMGIFLFLASMTFRHSMSSGIDSVALFFALGVPILDTLLAILRRARRGVGLMVPDREHLHHRLGRLGLRHDNIVRFLHFLTLYLCGVGAAFLNFRRLTVPMLVLALAGLGINLLLLWLAEKKLYSYLAHFSSHMLGVLDFNARDSAAFRAKFQLFSRNGVPCVLFRLDLDRSVSSLLERSPERIQTFYSRLSRAIRGTDGRREVQFVSSREAQILEPLPTGALPLDLELQFRYVLEQFERDERVDLGMHLSGTLTVIEHDRVTVPRHQEAA